jgi:hypothetical protein
LSSGPQGVLAGFLVGEDPPAVGGGERADLAFELLPAGGDPGVADADAGEHRRFGDEQPGGFERAGHVCDLLRKQRPGGC